MKISNRHKKQNISTSRRLALITFSRAAIAMLLGATVIATYNGQRKTKLSKTIADSTAKVLGSQLVIVNGWVMNKKDLR